MSHHEGQPDQGPEDATAAQKRWERYDMWATPWTPRARAAADAWHAAVERGCAHPDAWEAVVAHVLATECDQLSLDL